MIPAFCDSSALVPLCIRQASTELVGRMLQQYSMVVWWAASVEMRSAFERLLRMGTLTTLEYASAGMRLDDLRKSWCEMQPSEMLRAEAERLMATYPLKAADSLQLAAAWIWSSGAPAGRTFICGDAQLLEAARRLGFLGVDL